MTPRLHRLDSLRGVAALAVLVTHSFVMVPWEGEGTQRTLIQVVHVLANAHAAVIVFFIISGYVLGLSLDRDDGGPRHYTRFLVRRVLRIYPAHLVSLVVITCVMSTFDHQRGIAGSTPIYRWMFPGHPSPGDLIFNALLISYAANGVTWTIGVEMALGAVFPALHRVARGPSLRGRVLVFGAMLALSRFASFRPGIYGWTLFLGLAGAPVYQRLIARLEGRRGSIALYVSLAIVVLSSILGSLGATATRLWVQGFSGAFVVFSAVFMKHPNLFLRLLDAPFLQKLGRISYSFYLYHLAAAYCVATFLLRASPRSEVEAAPFTFGVCVTTGAFLIAGVIARWSYRFVEMPAARLPLERLGRPSRLPSESRVVNPDAVRPEP